MTVADDLATLPEIVAAREMTEILRRGGPGWLLFAEKMPDIFDAALVRVEAEIARLEQECDGWHEIADTHLDTIRAADLRHDRAEAEIARLKEGQDLMDDEIARLRDGVQRIANWTGADDKEHVSPLHFARALLAEDGADCVCGETSTRNCPVHAEDGAAQQRLARDVGRWTDEAQRGGAA